MKRYIKEASNILLWGFVLLVILRLCDSFTGNSSFPDLVEIPADDVNLMNYIDAYGRYPLDDYYAMRLWKLIRDDEELYSRFFKDASDLQKEEIRNSVSFKKYKRSLQEELYQLLSYTYYLKLGNIGDYNINSGNFKVLLSDWTKKKSTVAGYTFDWYSDALTHLNNISDFWVEDLPFDVETGTYWGEPAFRKILEFPFPKEKAAMVERGTMYLVFNPVNELKKNYVRTRDVGVVIIKNNRIVYAAKISDFDHKTEWRKSP
jgi:hypothetical protein